MSHTLPSPPACFRLSTGESGEELVIYRMRGRAVLLVMGLLLAWTSGTGVVVACSPLGPAARLFKDGLNSTALMIVFGWVAVTLGAMLLLGSYFLKTTFRLNREHLAIQKRVFGFSWNRRIDRGSIACFEQAAMPSSEIPGTFDWDLIVRAPHPQHLLSRVEREVADWFGLKLATFYNVEFKPGSVHIPNR